MLHRFRNKVLCPVNTASCAAPSLQTSNVEDVASTTDISKAALGSLLKYTLHMNVTPGGFTAVKLMNEMDPENPVQLCSARFDLEASGFNLPWVNSTSAEAVVQDGHYVVDLGRVFVSEQVSARQTFDELLP